MTYQLLDAQAKHREHPTTFEVPSITEIQMIQPGDYVKLGFIVERKEGVELPSVERMWVQVSTVRPFSGFLDNHPAFVPLQHSAPISRFEARNIMGIMFK